MPKSNDKKAPGGQHGMADSGKKSGKEVSSPKNNVTPANSGKKDGVSNHSNFKSGGRPKK